MHLTGQLGCKACRSRAKAKQRHPLSGGAVSGLMATCVELNSAGDQVGQAMSELDQVTQQNAALVEQSASAAESLRRQALELQCAVTSFWLSGAPHAD